MACNNDTCTDTVGPNFPQTGTNGTNGTTENCTTTPSGRTCPDVVPSAPCTPFQLTKNQDACFIDSVVEEALGIAGADLNVYKLLGVHEQCKLIDQTGRGQAISNGDAPGYPASNAFDTLATEWRSVQLGTGVLASAYVGYDFGELKTNDDSRRRYGIETSVRKHITAITIKQSSDSTKRATRIRVERSEDGVKWYGVAIVDVPDDDCLNTVLFGDSVLMRYWRLRPIVWNGSSNDYWGVQAIQMFHNYVATDTFNIQDKVFLENRDRDYASDSIEIKGSYELIDVPTELTRAGIELPAQTMYLTVNFSAVVRNLGRPLIVGDIVEIPSEAQFSSDLRRIQKWMEVTDVAWSTEGYTPGWQPTLQRVVLEPAYASQETQDIFGDLAEQEVPDELGLVDKGTGFHPFFQDYEDVSQQIQQAAKEMVPQSGREISSTIRQWEPEELQSSEAQGLPAERLQRIGQTFRRALYAEDAMPPNNEPFTEGTEFPGSPSNGDYHRLTYEGLSKDVPARLFRYSQAKGRWVFLEKDRRAEFDPNKPKLQEFLVADGRRSPNFIVRDDPGKCDTRED